MSKRAHVGSAADISIINVIPYQHYHLRRCSLIRVNMWQDIINTTLWGRKNCTLLIGTIPLQN